MAPDAEKHVFISYVREDDTEVDQLCSILEAAGIPYWRDRTALGPGDAWKAKIKNAIKGGSLVFLACFSDNSRNKDSSYMNEELTLAVDEFRKMPPGRTWLIPVRFDKGDVPDWELGAGRTLSDLNYSDLFGDKLAAQVALLVTTIRNLMGEKRLGPEAALEAVEQATAANRGDLLKRLTKEMLLDSARRIELDDLVSQEVRRIVTAINETSDPTRPGEGGNQHVVRLAERATELFEITKPFCSSLQVAGRYGSVETLSPWVEGIRTIVQAANKTNGGGSRHLELRHLPGMVSILSAGLACVASNRWENLKALVVDSSVRNGYDAKPLALLEASDPYRPFDSDGWTANTLGRAVQTGASFEDTITGLVGGKSSKLYTPVAEWLHAMLRPVFNDQLPDDDAYSGAFDRTEVVLGVLAQDAVNVRIAASPEGKGWGRSHWFGRSTWRAAHFHGNPVDDLSYELQGARSTWPPLRAELFGGEISRAEAALEKYAAEFSRISSSRL